MFSFKNYEISHEKYCYNIMRSLKISDAFKLRTFLISDETNFLEINECIFTPRGNLAMQTLLGYLWTIRYSRQSANYMISQRSNYRIPTNMFMHLNFNSRTSVCR